MKINFQQGVVSHQTNGAGGQDFIAPNGSNLSLKAGNRPVTVAIAHAGTNYIHTENITVDDAWLGPFSASVDYWLYWDFDPLTFQRRFGYTTLEPVVQNVEPGSGDVAVMQVIPGAGSPSASGAFIIDGYFLPPINKQIDIVGSSTNDGTYTITQVMFDELTGYTQLTVSEPVVAAGTDLGVATLDVDMTGAPLLQDGRHWFNTDENRHYVYDGGLWREVIRVFACQLYNGVPISHSVDAPKFTGTQIGVVKDVRAGRVMYDEAANVVRRDDGTFFTTEDQFFANAARVDAIRLESNVIRAQFTEATAAAFSIVAFTDDGKIKVAGYNDVGSTIVGVLTEDLNNNEVGGVIIQGVVTNNAWNWTGGVSAVPVGSPLWVENGMLVPYDPHVYNDRASSPIQVTNVADGYFEVGGAYTLSFGQTVGVIGSSANNDGNYRVVSSEYISAQDRTRVYVNEEIIDPVSAGEMKFRIGNYPVGQVPVARVLDADTVVFEQGLGGKGDRGPAGSVENMPPATVIDLGAVYLNLDPAGDIPLVVGDNDPRLSDTRDPNQHTHVATEVTVDPVSGIVATNAQAALVELSLEKLELAGGTMLGPLTLAMDPTVPLHAATKQYVDGLVAGLVWLPPICVLNMISDVATQPPLSPEVGDSYLLTSSSTGLWSAIPGDHVVTWDGASWIDRGPLTALQPGDIRIGIAMYTSTPVDPLSSFASDKNNIAVYDGTGAKITTEVPAQNNAVYVCSNSETNAFNQFAFSGTEWVLFGGGVALSADETTITQQANVLSVIPSTSGGQVDARTWQGLVPTDLDPLYAPQVHTHSADQVSFAPYSSSVPGDISSTDVQAALQEVHDEKAATQPTYANFAALPDPVALDGMLAHTSETHEHWVAQNGAWQKLGVYPLQIPYDISYFLAGQMLFASAVTGSFMATREIGIGAGAPGSLARCRIAPQIDVTYELIVDDGTATTPVGDVTFLAGTRDGIINVPGIINLMPGHELQLITPAVLEGFIQDVSITLIGCAEAPNCSQPVAPPNPLQNLWAPYDHLTGSDLIWNGNGWYYDGDYGGCTACSRALVPVGGWEVGYRPANVAITVELEGDPDWGGEYIDFIDTDGNNIIGAPTNVTVGGANTYVLNYPLDFGNGFDLDYLGLFLGECFYAAGCAHTDRPWTITDITLSGTWMPI